MQKIWHKICIKSASILNPAASRAATRPGTRALACHCQGPGCARPVTAADRCWSRGFRRRHRPLPPPAANRCRRRQPTAADRCQPPPTAACRLLPAGTMGDAGQRPDLRRACCCCCGGGGEPAAVATVATIGSQRRPPPTAAAAGRRLRPSAAGPPMLQPSPTAAAASHRLRPPTAQPPRPAAASRDRLPRPAAAIRRRRRKCWTETEQKNWKFSIPILTNSRNT